MVYNVEKMLREGGDKVAAADKSDVETALADAKSTLAGSDPSKTEMDAARERLTTASHKLAEALYKAQAAGAAPTDGDAAAAGTADQPKDEGVIDAEYVDSDK
jgi:molecular chaperone DnaK